MGVSPFTVHVFCVCPAYFSSTFIPPLCVCYLFLSLCTVYVFGSFSVCGLCFSVWVCWVCMCLCCVAGVLVSSLGVFGVLLSMGLCVAWLLVCGWFVWARVSWLVVFCMLVSLCGVVFCVLFCGCALVSCWVFVVGFGVWAWWCFCFWVLAWFCFWVGCWCFVFGLVFLVGC